MLRGQPVLKAQHIVAGDVGQLGGQHPGITQVAAGIAAAVAVEDHPAVPMGRFQPGPGSRHGPDGKLFILHPRHRGGKAAQNFLVPALMLQLLRGHGLRGTGAVQGFQRPHQRVHPGFFGIRFPFSA